MPVQSILDPVAMPQNVKADAYDAYTSSSNADDLQKRLDKLPLPGKVKADLWDAKNAEAAAAQTAQPAAASDTWDPRTWDLGHNPVSNTLAGIGSGVISTGVGAYNLARKIPGAANVLPAPNATVQAATQAPPGFFGGAGKLAEQGAEFMLPMSKVAKAVEAGPLAVRLATEALAAGGIAGVQTGGDVPAMAETAATTGALGGLGAAIPAAAKMALNKAISNGVRPLSQAAQDLAAKYGIPLTQGMLGGSKTVQAVEKMMGHSVAPDLYEPLLQQGQQGLNNAVQDVSGGFSTDKFTAGHNVVNGLLDAAKGHADTAATEYSNLAGIEADPANARTVQVGTKPNPSLDPTAPATVPDMQPMGLPTDMRSVKAVIAPQIANIERVMTPAQRNMDPALTALKNIMERPDALPASVAEQDLGYLKRILRDPNTSAQSGRLATIAAGALQPAIDSAVSIAPDALDSIQNARGSWAANQSIMDDVKTLTGDATGQKGHVMAVNKLLQPSDANYPLLERTLMTAPGAAQDLGQAHLTENVFRKAAQEGADFTNPTQAQNLLNHLGPRTRAAIYTPEQTENLNSLLELAKRAAENPNPSGTGTINTLLKMGVMVTHPVQGAIAFGLGRNVAKILYNPAAVANVRLALERAGTPEASKAMLAVKSLMNSGETDAAGNGSPALNDPGTVSPAVSLPIQ